MRAALLLVLVAGCGFPKPADRCDGPCGVFSIDRALAHANDDIALEGTFEDGTMVNFPGNVSMPLDSRGEHRAFTRVPPEATTGILTITTRDGVLPGIPFRRLSFATALHPFTISDPQTDAARLDYAGPARPGSSAITVADHLYLIGGSLGASNSNEVQLVLGGADGSITKPRTVGALKAPRAFHTSVRVGRYIYVFGGVSSGTTGTVERASINSDNTIGMFEDVPNVRLVTARSGHASAIMGNYVYVIGGRSDAGELDDLERAPIYEGDNLGPFEQVSGIKMRLARSNFSIAQLGNALFVIGGLHGNLPETSIEAIQMFGDGFISEFQDAGQLSEPRARHVSVIVGDDVYVIGGANSSGTLASVERAKIAMQTSLSFSPASGFDLGEAKQDAALAVVGNYVYVIGGFRYVSGSPTPAIFVDHASIVEEGKLDAFATLSGTELQIARSQHTSMMIGNKLYVVGGIGPSGTAVGQIEVSEVREDGTIGPFSVNPNGLSMPRYGHQMFTLNNKLYVVGGTDSTGTPIPTVEVAEIFADGVVGAFSTIGTQLQTARERFSILGGGFNAYFLGGNTAGGATASVEYLFYTTQLNGPQSYSGGVVDARSGSAAIMLRNYAYVLGGVDGTTYRGVVRAGLDAATNGLATIFTAYVNGLATPREGHSLVYVGNTLYVVGGKTGNGNTPSIETTKVGPTSELSPFTTSTTTMLQTPRTNHTTVTIGNYVYVIGGTVGSSSSKSIEVSTIR